MFTLSQIDTYIVKFVKLKYLYFYIIMEMANQYELTILGDIQYLFDEPIINLFIIRIALFLSIGIRFQALESKVSWLSNLF